MITNAVAVDELVSEQHHNALRSALLGEHLNTTGSEHAETINLGDGTTATNRALVAKRLGGNRAIQWNEAAGRWEVTNDGVTYQAFQTSDQFLIQHLADGGHAAGISLGDDATNGDRVVTVKRLAGNLTIQWSETAARWELNNGTGLVAIVTSALFEQDHLAGGLHANTLNLGDGTADGNRILLARRSSGNRALQWSESAAKWQLDNGSGLVTIMTVPDFTAAHLLTGQHKTTLDLGDGTDDGNRSIVAQRLSGDRELRWNETTGAWEFSNDGAAFRLIAARRRALATTADSTTVANTVVDTTFSQTHEIPANGLAVGSTVALRASGRYSTTGTITLEFRVKLGTTTVCTAGALTSQAGASDAAWSLEAELTFRTVGASGAVSGAVEAVVSSGTGTTNEGAGRSNGAVSIATDVALACGVSVEMSVADAANTCTLERFRLEQIDL